MRGVLLVTSVALAVVVGLALPATNLATWAFIFCITGFSAVLVDRGWWKYVENRPRLMKAAPADPAARRRNIEASQYDD